MSPDPVSYQNVFVGLDAAEKTAAQNCINENKLRIWQIYAQEHIEAIEEAASVEITDAEVRSVIENPALLSAYGLSRVATLLPSNSNVIKIVWMSKSYSSWPQQVGSTVSNNLGASYMWLALMNKNAADAKTYSMTAVHEMGHDLGLALTEEHLQPDGTPYEPYMLMCRGENTNGIIHDAPDRSAKHWTLKDGALLRGSNFCTPQ